MRIFPYFIITEFLEKESSPSGEKKKNYLYLIWLAYWFEYQPFKPANKLSLYIAEWTKVEFFQNYNTTYSIWIAYAKTIRKCPKLFLNIEQKYPEVSTIHLEGLLKKI